ncbi:MAG TPA: hypothetical protein VM491_20815 [Burkholderiaceae bacterium]|nr:hypothetical protein [Burkholderiaceae bacterium]
MTIEQHQHSGVTVPRLETVRTSADWVALWNQHVAPRVPPPAPPAIDFQQRMVLGVFVGQRPTGCHQVQIERVEVFGTAFIRASYRETVPGPAAVCPAVVTHPAHLVSVRVLHRIPVEFFELPPQTVGGGAAPAANDADPTRGQ